MEEKGLRERKKEKLRVMLLSCYNCVVVLPLLNLRIHEEDVGGYGE